MTLPCPAQPVPVLPPLTEEACATLRALRSALVYQEDPQGPVLEHEWAAVRAWLGCFYPFQLEWLLDASRFSLYNKSRQIGISHTIGGGAGLWALLGETTTVVSVGEREAKEVLDKAKRHCEVLYDLGSRWAEPVMDNTTELRLRSGGRVIALPAKSGGRGYSGNIILDELAYYDRPELVWDGAAAVVLHGYRLRGMSTPNGVGNLWHDLWTDPAQHDGYRLLEVTIEVARRQGMRVDDAECWKMARGDPRLYAQLFMCKFLDGDMQYVPTDLVEGSNVVHRGGTGALVPPHGSDLYGGLDVGKTTDRTVLVLLWYHRPTGLAIVRRVEARKRTSEEDLQELARLAMGAGCRRLCVDATGLGSFPAENLQKKHGRHKVEPVVFGLESKEDMATRMYQFFADKRILTHPEHKDVRDAVCTIRRIVTDAGNVRYDAPQTSKGHADHAWALALALRATGDDRRKFELRDPEPGQTVHLVRDRSGMGAFTPPARPLIWPARPPLRRGNMLFVG